MIICIILGLFAHPSWAQESPQVALTFSTFALGNVGEEIYYAEPKNEAVPLRFKYRARSGPYEYRGPTPLTFFTIEGEGAEAERRPIARAKIPSGVGEALLLFVPYEHDGLKYGVYVTPDDLSTFPANSIVFVNFTPRPMIVRMDEDVFQVEPGRSPAQDLSPWIGREVTLGGGTNNDSERTRRVSAVPIEILAPMDEEWVRVYSRVMRLGPDKRYIFYAFREGGPESGGVNTRILDEVVRSHTASPP